MSQPFAPKIPHPSLSLNLTRTSQDTAEWSKDTAYTTDAPTIDKEFEAGRADLKRQAQEWAGLEQNPEAELFVFVGRWSLQKGVDLIADIFPWVLETYPQTQLIVSTADQIRVYGLET